MAMVVPPVKPVVQLNAKLPASKKSTFEIRQKSGSGEIEVARGGKKYKVVFYKLSGDGTAKEKIDIDLTKNLDVIQKIVGEVFDGIGATANLQKLNQNFKGDITKIEIYLSRAPGSADNAPFTPDLKKLKISNGNESHEIPLDWWYKKLPTEASSFADKIRDKLTEFGRLVGEQLPQIKVDPTKAITPPNTPPINNGSGAGPIIQPPKKTKRSNSIV